MSRPIPQEYLADQWLSAKTAAEMLGISTKTLRRRTDAGRIGFSQDGKHAPRYYRRDEIEGYRARKYRPAKTVPIDSGGRSR